MNPFYNEVMTRHHIQELENEAEMVRISDSIQQVRWEASGKVPFWYDVLNLPLLSGKQQALRERYFGTIRTISFTTFALGILLGSMLATGLSMWPALIIGSVCFLAVMAPITARLLHILVKRVTHPVVLR